MSRVRAPDELGAEQRAWTVVQAAYADRVPALKRRSRGRLAVGPAVLVLAGALALSPAGATVTRWIRHTLGIAHSAPALLSLPARGSLLVSGPDGTWSIAADGATRRLGSWQQASWSPHGLFIAVAGRHELAAIDPRGTSRWTLARSAVSDPSWYPPAGLRIAYLSGRDLRVVAGDGTGDRLLASDISGLAPAWRPDHPYQVTYVDHDGRVVLRDATTGQTIWTLRPPANPRQLAWSADGIHLLVVTRSRALVYDAAGHLTAAVGTPLGPPILDGSLSPNGRTLALVRAGAPDDVVLADVAQRASSPRRVLSGQGLQQVTWSPDGHWLLVSWPLADQWVFIRVSGTPRIAAVSHIARQFSAGAEARTFPHLEGWCCTARGPAG